MVKFYSVQIKDYVEVSDEDVELITTENGRPAARATVTRDGKELKLYKFLSQDDADQLKQSQMDG